MVISNIGNSYLTFFTKKFSHICSHFLRFILDMLCINSKRTAMSRYFFYIEQIKSGCSKYFFYCCKREIRKMFMIDSIKLVITDQLNKVWKFHCNYSILL